MVEILVIDDDVVDFKPGLEHALRGYRLHWAESGKNGLETLEGNPEISLVLLDIKMPPHFAKIEHREGVEVLKRIKDDYPDLPVIMLTVLTDVELVVEAIQAGAFHYITKPLDRDKLRDTVRRATENVELKRQVGSLSRARDAVLSVHTGPRVKKGSRFQGMIGAHPLMKQLYSHIERAAQFDDMNIVILGETGSGKDLAARAIHQCSARRKKPYIAVNCASFPETVLDSELFGHEKGAFTGAESAHEGLFRQASGGTLFLDEIGEMSPALQSKLLRAIENQEVRPVGGKPVKVDVRLVCATHRDLAAAKEEGDFRADLYYRIWDIPITIPGLRERPEDIPLLVRHFLDASSARNNIACSITPEALAALAEHDWPGNVRELASTVRRLAVFAKEGVISEAQVRNTLGLAPGTAKPSEAPPQADAEPAPEPETKPTTLSVKTAASSESAPAPEDYPEIEDLGEFRRIHGEIRLKQVLERAIREGGNARAAMALLAMPDDRYDVFRKWLQRLDISVRELTE